MPHPWTRRRLSGEERRKALTAAANDILAMRMVEVVDGRPPKDRPSRFERLRHKADVLRRKGKLEPFGEKIRVRQDQGVYVIGAAGFAVKIGIATDPERRLKEIQTGSPERLRIYAFVELASGLARAVERECHAQLDHLRKNGEWFDIEWREAVDLVRRVAGKHSAAAA